MFFNNINTWIYICQSNLWPHFYFQRIVFFWTLKFQRTFLFFWGQFSGAKDFSLWTILYKNIYWLYFFSQNMKFFLFLVINYICDHWSQMETFECCHLRRIFRLICHRILQTIWLWFLMWAALAQFIVVKIYVGNKVYFILRYIFISWTIHFWFFYRAERISLVFLSWFIARNFFL